MQRVLTWIAFALMFAILCGLGSWQLSRAGEKRERYTQFTQRFEARPIDFDLIAADADAGTLSWRRAVAAGRYDGAHILLDNRIRNGVAGYEVLSPFVTQAGRHLLVNRGWIPLPAERSGVPHLAVPEQAVVVDGFLGPPPVVGIELSGESAAPERLGARVFRIQRPRLDALSQMLGFGLWPVVLYLGPEAPGALDADWPVPGDGSAKHQAYAVQWFAMAAVLAVIGVVNLRKRAADSDA